MPKKLTYPIFIKTNNSFANWKSDAGIAHNEQELVELCDSFASDEWMMEDFIDKKFEDSWQGISVNGGQQVYMPYRKDMSACARMIMVLICIIKHVNRQRKSLLVFNKCCVR